MLHTTNTSTYQSSVDFQPHKNMVGRTEVPHIDNIGMLAMVHYTGSGLGKSIHANDSTDNEAKASQEGTTLRTHQVEYQDTTLFELASGFSFPNSSFEFLDESKQSPTLVGYTA